MRIVNLQRVLRVKAEFLQQTFRLVRAVGIHFVQIDGVGYAWSQHTHQGFGTPLEGHLGDLDPIHPIATDGTPRPHIVKGFDPHVQERDGGGHFWACHHGDARMLFEQGHLLNRYTGNEIDLPRP